MVIFDSVQQPDRLTFSELILVGARLFIGKERVYEVSQKYNLNNEQFSLYTIEFSSHSSIHYDKYINNEVIARKCCVMQQQQHFLFTFKKSGTTIVFYMRNCCSWMAFEEKEHMIW